jgi:hypothetical protein
VTLNQHYASSSQGVESRPIILEFAVLSILISRATHEEAGLDCSNDARLASHQCERFSEVALEQRQ